MRWSGKHRRAMVRTAIALSAALLWAGCGIVPVEYDDTMLDADTFSDTSLVDPTFLLSRHPDLASMDRATPVIICAHGYGASTFEWWEFRNHALADTAILTSLVLLGGHGRSIDEFKDVTWEEWGTPITDEYTALADSGFTNITLAGSSTGATLIVEQVAAGSFDTPVRPKWIFLVDPIIVPANKLLTMIDAVGPVLGNSLLVPETDESKRYWYHNRPTSTLDELYELTEKCRRRLEKGITLPEGTQAKVYKATADDAADPIGALLLYKGMRRDNGGRIEVEIIKSDLHVVTRLRARKSVSDKDRETQQRIFGEMVAKSGG